jgi:hypothetical protein
MAVSAHSLFILCVSLVICGWKWLLFVLSVLHSSIFNFFGSYFEVTKDHGIEQKEVNNK